MTNNTIKKQWNSNETFSGTAYYYARFRPNYSNEVFKYLSETFLLNKDSNILDLGCGTGQIALEIAKNVKHVYAIDPQDDMLNEGKALAQENNTNNITWKIGQDSDINNLINKKIDLTTIGRAFHWMNREKVLEDLYSITNNGGGIAIIGDSKIKVGKMEWENIRDEVIKKYLGEDRKAGKTGTYSHPTKLHEDIIKESKFKDIKIKTIDFTRVWTIDKIIGYCYSTSFCSIPLLGNKKDDFEKDLKEELLKLNFNGKFNDTGNFEVITAIK